jgi:hypothetical protein
MITLKKSNNIFYNKKVILNYFLTDEFGSSDELNEIDWFELKIKGEDNDEVFDDFLEKFITHLKEEFYIDFITYQRSDQVKNRMRTYAKYFYDLRKQHLINEKYIVEKEIDTRENHSIFSGILQVDRIDNEMIFEELLNNYSRIIHAEIKEKKPNRLAKMLDKIDLELLWNNKLVDINYTVLLERFIKPNSILISYMYDGKDDLILTIYSGRNVSNKLEKIITDSIPSDQMIKEVIATSNEVDNLIKSYFNDWGKVKVNK